MLFRRELQHSDVQHEVDVRHAELEKATAQLQQQRLCGSRFSGCNPPKTVTMISLEETAADCAGLAIIVDTIENPAYDNDEDDQLALRVGIFAVEVGAVLHAAR